MVDRNVYDRRLAKLEELLRHLRALAEVSRAEFLADFGLQAKAERWLHLAAECCLDMANHLIADRGWRTPTSYREIFQVLATEGVLDSRLAAQMEDWARFRNVLVHLYLSLESDRVYDALKELDQLERYAAAVAEAALEPDS